MCWFLNHFYISKHLKVKGERRGSKGGRGRSGHYNPLSRRKGGGREKRILGKKEERDLLLLLKGREGRGLGRRHQHFNHFVCGRGGEGREKIGKNAEAGEGEGERIRIEGEKGGEGSSSLSLMLC